MEFMDLHTKKVQQEQREDQELFDNFPIWDKEIGQLLFELWGFYFDKPRAENSWSDLPHNMKNKWIRTSVEFHKTITKKDIVR